MRQNLLLGDFGKYFPSCFYTTFCFNLNYNRNSVYNKAEINIADVFFDSINFELLNQPFIDGKYGMSCYNIIDEEFQG